MVASRAFFAQARQGRFQLVVSTVVEEEMVRAPSDVQQLFQEILGFSNVQLVSEPARRLAQAYLDVGIPTQRSRTDALHVALATVAGCAVIVSWNFRDLVNYFKVPLYGAVNVLHGYPEIAILSPPEVTGDDTQEEDV